MTDGWIVGWMTGFEHKGKQRMLSYTKIIGKGISDFLTGLFYSYVSVTQPSSHPLIQSSMGRE
jgi:hypothetical protein